MKFTIVDAMRAAGYEALPGGAECIRKAESLESRNETPVAPDDSTRKGQMELSVILDEIEERMKAVQEKEYDSVWKFRKAVGMSADDVPALVRALRAANKIIDECDPDTVDLWKWELTAILTQREP